MKTNVFCSRKCYLAKKAEAKMICVNCNKMFIGDPQAKFCSRQCNYMHNHGIDRCKECGVKFIPKSYKGRKAQFCNRKCYNDYLEKCGMSGFDGKSKKSEKSQE